MGVEFEEEKNMGPIGNIPKEEKKKGWLLNFLIDHKIADDEDAANKILIISFVVFAILTITIVVWKLKPTPLAPQIPFKNLPEEIKNKVPASERETLEQYDKY